MKNFLTVFFALSVCLTMSSVYAEETSEPTKTEQIMDTITVKTQMAAERTADSIKSGSIKAGQFVKEKSSVAAESTAMHAKSGAGKLKRATLRGANKVSNKTARGMKKFGEKMQNSADRTIEKTAKNIEEMSQKSNCNCGENCKCNVHEVMQEE